MGTYQILYDVSRSPIELAPGFGTAVWMLGFAMAIIMVKSKLTGQSPRLFWPWLAVWLGLGGFGFGTVWYEHSRCVRELESGKFQVVEGQVTRLRPQRGKHGEEFAVGGVTFHNFSAKLARGRPTAGTNVPLHVGACVRIAYDTRGEILRLEIQQPPNVR